jgi:hypothetical protein
VSVKKEKCPEYGAEKQNEKNENPSLAWRGK